MENYDRFAEIQESAMNAEDASVLQYAKTLDSLESKLNQISNSFQQFYMSILNGPVIGSFLSFLNQVVTGFTKLGNFSSLFNIISIIKGVKTLASFLLTTFSDTGSSISIKLKQAFQETISVARDAGRKAKLAYEDGFNGTNLQPNINLSATGGGTTVGKLKNILSNLKQNPSALINLGLNVGGGLLSSAGAAISGNGNSRLGSVFSAGGSALSMASYGLTLGGPMGAVAGGAIGLISQLPAIISSFKNALEESIENLKKEQEDANIKRVEDKQAASDLQSYIDKYNKLQKAQYDSAEAAQAYVDIQNEIAEKYPQYVSYLTESGDAVVNMSTATQDLSKALEQAAESAQTWADKLIKTKEAELESARKNLGLNNQEYDENGIPIFKNAEQFRNFSRQKYLNAGDQAIKDVFPHLATPEVFKVFTSKETQNLYLSDNGITKDSTYRELTAAMTGLFGVDSLDALAKKLTEVRNINVTGGTYLETYVEDILGNVFDFDTTTQEYKVSEKVNEYLESLAAYTESLTISISAKTYAYGHTYLKISDNASLLKNISGEEAIISQMVKQTGISAKDYKQENYNATADQFAQFWQSYGTDTLESYMQDFNKVSKTAMDKALATARKSDDAAVQATVAAFDASFEENREPIVKMLTINAKAFGTEYYQKLVAPIINDLSNEQIKDFNSRLVELKTMAEEGGAYGKAQADRQMVLLAKYYANITKLAPDLQVKFLNNFGSSEWATSFSSEEIQELVDAGILNVGDSIDNYIYEQLNTYLNGTSERLADLATAFTSATDKQLGSGFTLKEAKEIVQKFHLDSFDSAFIYDVFQGAYYLTNKAQQTMRDNLNQQVTDIQNYSDALKKLQVKNQNGFNTEDYVDTFAKLTLQQQQAIDQIKKNATVDGVIDIDIYNKGIQDIIDTGQISINDATNQLIALNIKDIQTAKQYVNSKDKRTADAAKAYVEEFYDYAAGLTGKVTADQISKLSTYGINTTLIKVGDEWNKAIEHIGDKQAKSIAKAAQAYSREEMKTKLSSGLQDIFTSIVSGEEVAANDVADLVESALGRSLNSSERDAIERELKESPQLLMEQLKAIITASLRSQGVDEEEIQKILTELTITVVETISTAIEDGVSLLAKGITDGISQSELKQLSNLFKVSPDQIASYDQSTGKYRTSGEQFISTLTTSPIMKGRDTYAYSRQLTETLGGKGGVLGSYESITKEIERVEKNIKESTDQEKARLKILKEMQAIYANIADSQRFDFMGYDMMQGQMDDFDNWIDSIQQVQDVFQGLSDSGGKMNYKNFLSMIDYIQKFHPDASSLQIAGQSLDQFAVAIMNTVDIAGNVDFSAVADAMTQGVGQMADAMKETLAEVARERIKTLEATKAALVAQLAVQKALESMQLKPEDMQVDWSKQNPVEDWITRITDSGKKAIDMMDDLTEEQKAASKAYLDSFPIGKQILDALGFKPEDMAKWEEDQQNAFNQIMAVFSSKIPDIMSQAAENVQASGISYSDSEQWGKAYYKEFQRLALIGWETAQSESKTTFEAPNAKIIGNTQIENLSTTTTTTSTEAKDTTKALTDTAAAIDKAEEAFKNLGQTGQEEIEKIKTAITDSTTQLDGLKESFNLGATETPMKIQLKAVIGKYTNAPGVDPNKQVENLNGIVGSFAPTAEGAASKEQLVDDLVATVDSFLPAPGVDKNSLVSDLTAIVNLSSDPETLYNNIIAYMSKKKVDVAIQLANDGNEEALANLWKDLNPAEQSLVALNATSETAAKTLKTVASNYTLIGAAAASTGLAINTSETNNQEKLAGTNDAVGNVSTKYGEASTAAGDASTAIANAESANQDNIKKTGDAAGVAKKKIADMARGEHKIKVNANTKPAIMAANQAVKDIEAKSATVTVTYRSEMTEVEKQNLRIQAGEGMPEPPKKGGLWNTVKSWFGGGKYQGTVNDLGPAYAQGTKTLVGELGPELAVYDNAYHLLGRNGAELVDIPDDAIIFNHKQTEGILKGQANNGRGKTVNGQPAFATGNVSGPAYAGGLSGAIAAIDREIMAWKALLSMTTADLLGSAGGGGGGGSGNTLKAHIEDLVEWYNLTRQIADIEQKINNIIAKRANITDGRAYLKSLREQQHLLEGQALVQKTLLGYQQKQLELQAEQINTHDIWKQFFHVGSDGLLQYNMGNEVNGGKGTLTLLQQLNQMSGAEQLSYIKNLGYSYVTNDGEQLDGEDLISQFFEEAQAQIDKYDELRDTVESTDEALSKLESSINEIEQEIRDNQKELEEIIYNTLVEAWEKQISQLQEQTDMLREANEAYVNGLNDALNKERNQYSQNKSISDRQQLQRQLSLLRRSGGSASQIASLEEQLNSALKEEYFSHQQETIDSIKEANDKQLDALNKQITLQQETLDFQKENGVLWTKVYEVLSQSDGKIMEFLIQNSSEFIQASALAQADMLNEEWAKRIGIYKANSEEGFEPYVQKANQMFATEAWNSAEGPQKQSMFNALDVASQKALQDYFASAFANEMLRNGGNESAAYEVARQDMYQKLYQAYNQMKNIQNTTLDAIRNISQPNVAPKDNTAGTGGGSNAGGSTGGNKDSSGSSKKQQLSITYKRLVTTGVSKGRSGGGSPSGPSSLEVGKSGTISWNCNSGFVQGGFEISDTSKCSISGPTITALASGSVTVTLKYWDRNPAPDDAEKKAKESAPKTTSTPASPARLPSNLSDAVQKKLLKNKKSILYADSGALVGSDNTPAILHKGEGVFTAGETSALRNMVKNYQTLAANLTGNSLLSAMSSIGSYSFSNTRNAGSELNINPGAVVIHVDKLDDKYDVDELATDVFNKLSTIASKATNRGVNRR